MTKLASRHTFIIDRVIEIHLFWPLAVAHLFQGQCDSKETTLLNLSCGFSSSLPQCLVFLQAFVNASKQSAPDPESRYSTKGKPSMLENYKIIKNKIK